MNDTSGAPDATSPAYRAGWAAEDAQEKADAATIAAGHAKAEAEIAAEDEAEALAEADEAGLGLLSLHDRLEKFLRSQPDVDSVEYVGDGIFGFTLAATGGMSLQVNVTP